VVLVQDRFRETYRMNDKYLNTRVAEAAGLTLINAVPFQIDACGNRIWSKSWFDKDGTCIANEDKWNPREDYNQIFACIEAKGWVFDLEKFGEGEYSQGYSALIPLDGKWHGPDVDSLAPTGPVALCLAFLAACEA
jgi:hypothetical protein